MIAKVNRQLYIIVFTCASFAVFLLTGCVTVPEPVPKKDIWLYDELVACDTNLPLNGKCYELLANQQNITTKKLFFRFTELCRNDDPFYCYAAGKLKRYGVGTTKDINGAIAFYRKACEMGEDYGCVSEADILYVGNEGYPKDLNKARKLYQAACKNGNMIGCADLGHMYRYGNGGVASKFYAKQLFEKACQHNITSGCVSLTALSTAEKEYTKAFRATKKECDISGGYDCHNLALMYRKGLGVPQSKITARKIYENSCRKNNPRACSSLGLMFADEKNFIEAQKYFSSSCKNRGYDYARINFFKTPNPPRIDLADMGCMGPLKLALGFILGKTRFPNFIPDSPLLSSYMTENATLLEQDCFSENPNAFTCGLLGGYHGISLALSEVWNEMQEEIAEFAGLETQNAQSAKMTMPFSLLPNPSLQTAITAMERACFAKENIETIWDAFSGQNTPICSMFAAVYDVDKFMYMNTDDYTELLEIIPQLAEIPPSLPKAMRLHDVSCKSGHQKACMRRDQIRHMLQLENRKH